MESPIHLSKEEEFWLVTGVVMRNWTALQIGVNESSERVESIKSKISTMLENIMDGVSKVKGNKCHWSDLADYLGDTICDQFDVVLDDDSDSSVVCHLLQLYDLIDANDRTAIESAMSTFQDRRHILSGELYEPQRVVRKEGLTSRTVSGSLNTSKNVCPLPRVLQLQSDLPSKSSSSQEVDELSTAQYSLFQPVSSSALRNTKLDQPVQQGGENIEMMSDSDDETAGSENDSHNGVEREKNSKGPSEVNPGDEWMVVERRRKRN